MDNPEVIKLNLIGEYDLSINYYGLDKKWNVDKIKDAGGLGLSATHVIMYGGFGILLYKCTTSNYNYGESEFSEWVVGGVNKKRVESEWDLPYFYELNKARNTYLENGGYEDYLKEEVEA